MDITIQVNGRYLFMIYEIKGKYYIELTQRPDNDDRIFKTAPTVKDALSMVIDICEKEGEQ